MRHALISSLLRTGLPAAMPAACHCAASMPGAADLRMLSNSARALPLQCLTKSRNCAHACQGSSRPAAQFGLQSEACMAEWASGFTFVSCGLVASMHMPPILMAETSKAAGPMETPTGNH